MNCRHFSAWAASLAGVALSQMLSAQNVSPAADGGIARVLQRVKAHDFHPTRGGTTMDRELNKAGVADLADTDWKVRTFAVRDMVKANKAAEGEIIAALSDPNPGVRHLAAMALGIRRSTSAVEPLEKLLRNDPKVTVRTQAAVALGQIGGKDRLTGLRAALQQEKDADVLHQVAMAIHAVEPAQPATPELAAAFASLDDTKFGIAKVGEPAPDFSLPDTTGKQWRLSDFRGKQNVLLVWIFADW